MADPDTNYLSNQEIGDEFFNGETVPGDNTISEDRNLTHKGRVDRIINRYLRVTTNKTDTYGDIKEIAFRLYGDLMNGINPVLTPQDKLQLERAGFVNPPLAMQRSDDFNEPDPV